VHIVVLLVLVVMNPGEGFCRAVVFRGGQMKTLSFCRLMVGDAELQAEFTPEM